MKSSGGVALRIFETLSARLERGHNAHQIGRFFAFVRSESGLRFSTHLTTYASALLSPYVDRQPEEQTLSMIEPFLLENFGDPRMDPGRWASVPEDLVAVIKRWLAKASLSFC